MRLHLHTFMTGTRTTRRTRRAGGTRRGASTGALAALTLAASLALGACSGGGQGAGDAASTSSPAASSSDTASSTDAAGTTVDTEALPDPVAEVNGEKISKEDFLAAFEQQRSASEQQAAAGGAPVDEVALRDGVLDALVGSTLLEQEGERLGLGASAKEVDSELDSLAEQNGVASSKELLSLLDEQGVTEEQAREEVGRLVVIDKILAERGEVKPPTDKELRDYYEEMTGGGDGAAASGSPEGTPAFKDIKDQLEQQLTAQKEDEALTTIVEGLKKDAKVTSYL